MRLHGASLTGVLLASLLTPSALAEPPPPAAEPAPPPAKPTTPKDATPKAAAPAKPVPKFGPAKAKASAPEPLPAPEVRLWVVAPSPTGPWAFRIDNEGSRPVRVPADVRLLRFEIDAGPGFVIDTKEPGKPGKTDRDTRPKKPITCSLPAPLRPDGFPDRSALILAPGEAYIESFDPLLFCFGKDASAALSGGAVVHARFGWDAPKGATKKPPEPPFAVEGTAFPAAVAPQRELSAPTMVLSFAKPKAERGPKPAGPAMVAGDPPSVDASKPAGAPSAPPAPADPKAPKARTEGDASKPAGAPSAPPAPADPKAPKARTEGVTDDKDEALEVLTRPPIVDENAPRLELTATPFVDVATPGQATITVKATNVGHRPMLAAIRPRMLAFRIEGPGGVTRCEAAAPTHAIPRDLFSSIKPSGSVSMSVLLSEVCPRNALARPGLYRIKSTLHAGEASATPGIDAYADVVTVEKPTYLRVLRGSEPFYTTAPRAAPIPRPQPRPDDDADLDVIKE
jgi:hypothetical protein